MVPGGGPKGTDPKHPRSLNGPGIAAEGLPSEHRTVLFEPRGEDVPKGGVLGGEGVRPTVDHHPGQLVPATPRVEREGNPGIVFDVSPRGRVSPAGDVNGLVSPHEPQRDDMGASVGASRRHLNHGKVAEDTPGIEEVHA